MKGMRVQSIIRCSLRGEKIDIIEFNDDPVSFATHALSPAKISRVSIIDSVEKHMEVIVDDTQLSLAIGKKGQNVRLAAKLLGWRIDIKSEEEKRQEVESQMAALVVPGAPVTVLMDHGLAEAVAEKLMAAGVGTVEKLGGDDSGTAGRNSGRRSGKMTEKIQDGCSGSITVSLKIKRHFEAAAETAGLMAEVRDALEAAVPDAAAQWGDGCGLKRIAEASDEKRRKTNLIGEKSDLSRLPVSTWIPEKEKPKFRENPHVRAAKLCGNKRNVIV